MHPKPKSTGFLHVPRLSRQRSNEEDPCRDSVERLSDYCLRNRQLGLERALRWPLGGLEGKQSISLQTSFSSAEASRSRTRRGFWEGILTGSSLVSTRTTRCPNWQRIPVYQ